MVIIKGSSRYDRGMFSYYAKMWNNTKDKDKVNLSFMNIRDEVLVNGRWLPLPYKQKS